MLLRNRLLTVGMRMAGYTERGILKVDKSRGTPFLFLCFFVRLESGTMKLFSISCKIESKTLVNFEKRRRRREGRERGRRKRGSIC